MGGALHKNNTLIGIFFLLCTVLSAMDLTEILPREPRFDLPKPYQPESSCRSCLKGARLDLLEVDKAVASIPLDLYAPQFSRQLLRIEHGHRGFQWDPSRTYTLAARGRDGSKNEITAFLQRVIVIFRVNKNEEGETDITCTSHPGYALTRSDNLICLAATSGQQFYFEADDIFGESWRLVKMAHTNFAGETLIKYEADHMSAIVYPDGKETVLEYNGDLLNKVTLPTGESYIIGRDVAGYISSVEFYAAPKSTTKQVLDSFHSYTDADGKAITKSRYRTVVETEEPLKLKEYLFENDSNGRITKMIDPCGSIVDVEFTFNIDRDGTKEHAIIATEENAGRYRFMRHYVIEHGRTWIIDNGVGYAGLPLKDARLLNRHVLRKYGNFYETEYIWNPDMGGKKYHYDRKTKDLLSTVWDNGRVRTWITTDNTSIITDTEGPTKTRTFNENGQCLFYQSENGLPTFRTYDSLNRPQTEISYEKLRIKLYNGDGNVSHFSETPFPFGSPDPELKKLQKLIDSKGRSSLLRADLPQDMPFHTFGYDILNQVNYHMSPDGTETAWTRDNRNLIIQKSVQRPSSEPERTTYDWDNRRQLVAITFPDTTTQEARYNCHHIKRFRGDDSTAYTFDERKRLTLTSSRNQQEKFKYNEWDEKTAVLVRHNGTDWVRTNIPPQEQRFPLSMEELLTRLNQPLNNYLVREDQP